MDNQNFTPFVPQPNNPQSYGSQPPITSPPQAQFAAGPAPTAQKAPSVMNEGVSKDNIRLILLIISAILVVILTILLTYVYLEWNKTKTNIQGQVDDAVATKINEKEVELDKKIAEVEKNPYYDFAGPEDYGSLTFKYPKTWSLYVEKDATNGGDYVSYLNPGSVNQNPSSGTTISALRISILTKSFADQIKTYESKLKNQKLTMEVQPVGGKNANIYHGELPVGKLVGYIAVFSIRDKTVVLQADAEVFKDDFFDLLKTVSFVE